jgi:hypothetical protein
MNGWGTLLNERGTWKKLLNVARSTFHVPRSTFHVQRLSLPIWTGGWYDAWVTVPKLKIRATEEVKHESMIADAIQLKNSAGRAELDWQGTEGATRFKPQHWGCVVSSAAAATRGITGALTRKRTAVGAAVFSLIRQPIRKLSWRCDCFAAFFGQRDGAGRPGYK